MLRNLINGVYDNVDAPRAHFQPGQLDTRRPRPRPAPRPSKPRSAGATRRCRVLPPEVLAARALTEAPKEQRGRRRDALRRGPDQREEPRRGDLELPRRRRRLTSAAVSRTSRRTCPAMTSTRSASTRCARLAIDAIQKADSGHPGLPLGASPMAYVLWQHHLKHAPANPHWADRDRFVLSAGPRLDAPVRAAPPHRLPAVDGGAAELPPVGLEDARATPSSGTPPASRPPPGPLGQGFANAVGMAIAERAPRRPLQPARPRGRRSLHLRAGRRRRRDGGRRRRGRRRWPAT